MMVGKDSTGKGRRTSKGLRMNKTVCKSCLNMFITFSMLLRYFVESFLPSDRKPLKVPMKRIFLFFHVKENVRNEKDCRLPILDILSSS